MIDSPHFSLQLINFLSGLAYPHDFLIWIVKISCRSYPSIVKELAFSASGSAPRFEEAWNFHLSKKSHISFWKAVVFFKNNFQNFIKVVVRTLIFSEKNVFYMLKFHLNCSIEMLKNLEIIKILEPGLLPDTLLVAITKKIFSLCTSGGKNAYFTF